MTKPFKTVVTEDFRQHIVNDSGMMSYWTDRGRDLIRNLQSGQLAKGEYWTKYQTVKFALADEMKEFYEDQLFGDGYSLKDELIHSAVAWVEWDDLADNFVSSAVEQICYDLDITAYVKADEFINNPHEMEEWILE